MPNFIQPGQSDLLTLWTTKRTNFPLQKSSSNECLEANSKEYSEDRHDDECECQLGDTFQYKNTQDDDEQALSPSRTDINAQDENGDTVLHIVCRQGNTELALTLIMGLRANHNIQNNWGETPLIAAVNANRIETASMITQKLPELLVKRNEMEAKKAELEKQKIEDEKRLNEVRNSMYM